MDVGNELRAALNRVSLYFGEIFQSLSLIFGLIYPILLYYIPQQNLGSTDPARLQGGTNTSSPAITPFRVQVQRSDPYSGSGSGRNVNSEYSTNEAGRNVPAGDAYGLLGERGAAVAWTDRSFRDQPRSVPSVHAEGQRN